MFIRVKPSGPRRYLQVVENFRDGANVRQRVIGTLGRLDLLSADDLDGMLVSLARFSPRAAVLTAVREGTVTPGRRAIIGPGLLFGRLWRELGLGAVVTERAADRRFGFPAERAVFLTVLHRLMVSGSDRACEDWRTDHAIPGTERLQLHHLYRTMGWLGEKLPAGRNRTTKDELEEELFARRRELFTDLEVVFFDTTSLYFEGEGGATLGQYGHSKDHRSDLRQMVVGLVLTGDGQPLCCELWPGNTTDVTSLRPVVERLRERFGALRVCVVCDRGMVSGKTVRYLESPGCETEYILGCRMRRVNEVRHEVLGRSGRYATVAAAVASDREPLEVKEVWVGERRYIVCRNEEQARKDAHDREAILAALADKLRQGDKALVGNRGFRRFLKRAGKGSRFQIDSERVRAEARFDGKWVLTTNTKLSAAEVANKYKQLWMVEQSFRVLKSVLATRPIYHRQDETIRGHVFCSFLALMLLTELQRRLRVAGMPVEWEALKRDLNRLEEWDLELQGKRFRLRTATSGPVGKVFQKLGIALPPTLRQMD